MRVIIAGTRTIFDYATVVAAIEASSFREEITEVVCGATQGQVEYAQGAFVAKLPPDVYRPNVDIIGAVLALMDGIPVAYFPADWGTYGKSAGPIRNNHMAEYAAALILVWDGTSRGSADMLRRAKAHGLKVYEHIVDNKPQRATL